MANVSVLGAGSWGLGLALLLNNNGHNVTVWSVLKDEVAMLQTEREHKRCLPASKCRPGRTPPWAWRAIRP